MNSLSFSTISPALRKLGDRALSCAAMRIALLVLVLSVVAAVTASAAPLPEVRGTWLTTTANDALATPAQIAATMKRLREIGLNTVYVECWKNGYTEFPSTTLAKTIKIDRKINLPNQPPSRD